jgi:hypothetical protein
MVLSEKDAISSVVDPVTYAGSSHLDVIDRPLFRGLVALR